jgi:hypothetical protein
MRRAIGLLLAVPVLAGAAWPDTIATWQGKAPTEKIGGTTLLAQRDFARGVKKIAGGGTLGKIRTRWTTVSPVARDGDLFLVQGCRKHACTDESYAVVVDRLHGVVAVCLGRNDGGSVVKTWTGLAGHPPHSQRESDMQHGCSGEPKQLFDEAKAFALQTPG